MPNQLFSIEPKHGTIIPTSHWLLVAKASAALETHPDEELRVPLSDQAGLFALSDNERVGPEERLEQARRIQDWWPPIMLFEAARIEVPWHLLLEPTRWDDVEHRAVWGWVVEYRQTRGRWPSVGAQREQLGRRHNHPIRVPEGQEGLDLGEEFVTYAREDYAAYREFVESIVDSAIAAAKGRNEDVGDPAILERYVGFDTALVDEMIQTRIIEVTTPGFVGRTVRYAKHGWAR